MAISPSRRLQESWLWIMGPLVLGFITPSLIILVMAVGVGGQRVDEAFKDVLRRQFAEGHNLFLLAAWGLIPFVALSLLLLILAIASVSPRRVGCLSVFGTLGTLGLMVPGHWSVWEPLYSGTHMSSTAVIAFIPLPFLCLVTMFVGLGIGALVSMLPVFQPKPPLVQQSVQVLGC